MHCTVMHSNAKQCLMQGNATEHNVMQYVMQYALQYVTQCNAVECKATQSTLVQRNVIVLRGYVCWGFDK